jgi:hypothetical protein
MEAFPNNNDTEESTSMEPLNLSLKSSSEDLQYGNNALDSNYSNLYDLKCKYVIKKYDFFRNVLRQTADKEPKIQ